MRMRRAITDSQLASRGKAWRGSQGRRPTGMSLVEVLIAAALLLIIILGVLPLFTQAMKSNTSGREATQVSNQARTRAEEYLQYPFNSTELTLTSGTQLVTNDYYSAKDSVWKAVPPTPPAGDVVWTRTTTIRQYGITVDAAGDTNLTAALDATAPAGSVQLKEIEVEIDSGLGGGPFGPAKSITVRVWKAF